MDYGETLSYLYSQLPMYQRVGPAAYKSDLGNTLELLSLQGNPEQRFRSIHIAGTNGKGSTAHLLAAVLQSQGYKTGLYTSPHLKDFRERIRLNGTMIPEDAVIRYVRRYRPDFDRIQPSFFEMTVGMAFEWFAEQQVDIAIIETGMGGRLDSTNVVTPLLSVITNISPDHTRFLGSDLPSIAREKAGIIKRGVPVVIGKAEGPVMEVFQDAALGQEAPLYPASQWVRTGRAVHLSGNPPLLVTDLQFGDEPWLRRISTPLTGHYQVENLRTAYCALRVLQQALPVSPGAILKGFREVRDLTGLRGRWEILCEKPLVIADTAHNEEGMRLVMQQWMEVQASERHVVIGMVDDKDPGAILTHLPRDARYYFCKPDVPRGMEALRLQAHAGAAGLYGAAYPSVIQAYSAARASCPSKGSIYVGGSTFVVAEVI